MASCSGCGCYEDDTNYSNWGKCTYCKKSIKNMEPVPGCKYYEVND